MGKARVVNGIFWLYLWLSDVLHPVTSGGDFWPEKARQLFHLNSDIGDPATFAGTGVLPLVLWLVLDWMLRRQNRRRETSGS